MATYNTIDEFRNEFRLTTEHLSDSEAQGHLDYANDAIYCQIPVIDDTSYPHYDAGRVTRALALLKVAERYLAFGDYLQSSVYDSRFSKPDLDILSLSSGLSRGAQTPMPTEAADWLRKEAEKQIERAKTILLAVKPRVYISQRSSPSSTFWTGDTTND